MHRLASLFTFALLCHFSAIHAGELKAGAAAIDISPVQLPAIVNGGFLERRISTIADRLHARSMVLSDGTDTLSITVVDSCMVPRDLCDQAKRIAHKLCGIPENRMLISSTHTHSAPSAMRALGTPADPEYIKWLPRKIAESIEAAYNNLQPAQLGFGSVALPDLVACRRWIYQPANMLLDPFGEKTVRANMHPGHQNPNAMGPTGPEDPDLTVLSIQTAAGKPLALLANYGMHYFSGPRGISADYFGIFADYVADELNADETFVGAMSNGTSGDMWRRDYTQPKVEKEKTITEYARVMAQQAARLAANIHYKRDIDLAMKEILLPLQRRVPKADRIAWAEQMVAEMGERAPKTRPEVYAKEALWLLENPSAELKLQVLRLGDYWINAIPNETYALTGLKLKSMVKDTMNISLANGAEGYIPPEEQYVLGGYNTWPARSAGLEEAAERKITTRLLNLRESFGPEHVGDWRASTDLGGPYRNRVYALGSKAYYPLDEMTPRTEEYFTVTTALTYEPGVVFYLPGIPDGDDEARAPHFAGGRLRINRPALAETYSVAFWMYNALPTDARPITGYAFSRGQDADETAAGDHLGIMGTQQVDRAGCLMFFNGEAHNQLLVGKTKLAPKTWHHVTLVRHQQEVRVYLDGLPEMSGYATVTRPREATTFMGGRCDNFANFEGKIDEVALWDRALTDVQVAGMLRERMGEPLRPGPRSPAQFIADLPMPEGLEIECVASEPLITDPIAIDFAADGRLWVVEMRDYPDGMNAQGAAGGRIKVLSDQNGDGIYDHAELFRDNLPYPTGVKAWQGSAIYCDSEGVHFPDGSTMTGFGNNTLHTRVNGPWWTLDNRLMFANGRNSSRIQWRGETYDIFRRDFSVAIDGNDLRTEGGQSQFGRTRDDWDNWFGVDYQTLLYHFPLPDHYLRRNPGVASPASAVYVPEGPRRTPVRTRGPGPLRTPHASEASRTTSHSGPCINRSNLLGDEYAGDAFVCEPSHTVLLRRKLRPQGSTFTAVDPHPDAETEWLASPDNWFRPTQVRSGPDGALWVVDMYRMIIEHTKWLPAAEKKTLNVRAGDASGRIYRIYPTGKRPKPWPNLKQLKDIALADELDTPHGTLRDMVQQEMLEREGFGGAPILRSYTLYEQSSPQLIAASLWSMSALGTLEAEDVSLALLDDDPRVRTQAAKICIEHRPDFPELIDNLLQVAKAETDPKTAQQLACTLGAWNDDPRVKTTLEHMINRFEGNHFIKAAALSSMPTAHREKDITWKIEARNVANTKRADLVRHALAELPEQGHAEKGEAIYQAQCLVCHAVKDAGNAIGPDLTALSNRSPEFLVEAILDPQRAIDPDYVALTLEMHDGKKLTGVMKDAGANNFTLATADGKLHEVLRKDVKAITNLNRSLMPETFDKTITDRQQLRDLIAYVQGLK